MFLVEFVQNPVPARTSHRTTSTSSWAESSGSTSSAKLLKAGTEPEAADAGTQAAAPPTRRTEHPAAVIKARDLLLLAENLFYVDCPSFCEQMSSKSRGVPVAVGRTAEAAADWKLGLGTWARAAGTSSEAAPGLAGRGGEMKTGDLQ